MKGYYINLDHCVARDKMMRDNPVSRHFTRVSAVDRVEAENRCRDEQLIKAHPGMSYAEVGCFLSHLHVWGLIANDATLAEDEYVMVCEDDIEILVPKYELLTHLLPTCKTGWVHCRPPIPIYAFSEAIAPIKTREINRLTTACYCISKALCTKLVTQFNQNKLVYVADVFDYLPPMVEVVRFVCFRLTSLAAKSNIR